MSIRSLRTISSGGRTSSGTANNVSSTSRMPCRTSSSSCRYPPGWRSASGSCFFRSSKACRTLSRYFSKIRPTARKSPALLACVAASNSSAPSFCKSLILAPAWFARSKCSCSSFSLSATASEPAQESKAAASRTTDPRPRGKRRLFLLLRPFFEDMNPLVRLPDLIRMLVAVQIQKFSIRIQGGLNLIEFIVTKRANKPHAGAGLFHLFHRIVTRQCRRVIPSLVKSCSQVLPVNDVAFVQLNRNLQFALSIRKFAFLQVQPPHSAVELRIPRRKRNRLFQRGDGFVQFVLPNEDIGAQAKRLQRWRLPVRRLLRLRKRFVILLVRDEQLHKPRARRGILRLGGKVVPVSLDSFRLAFRIKAQSQAPKRQRGLRLPFENAPIFLLSLGRLVQLQVNSAQMNQRLIVSRIQVGSRFERFSRSSEVSRALERNSR